MKNKSDPDCEGAKLRIKTLKNKNLPIKLTWDELGRNPRRIWNKRAYNLRKPETI